MSCWGKDQQVCATCRYWSGIRTIDFSASFFETDYNASGECNGPMGSFRGVEMGNGSSCMEWEAFRS